MTVMQFTYGYYKTRQRLDTTETVNLRQAQNVLQNATTVIAICVRQVL